MKNKKTISIISAFVLIAVFATGCINKYPDTNPDIGNNLQGIKQVASMSHLKSLLKTQKGIASGMRLFGQNTGFVYKSAESDYAIPESAASDSSDYSQTNVQVQGVDEADIVKTDGKNLFIISNSKKIKVISTDDSGMMEQKPDILDFPNDFYLSELYVDDNQLIAIGTLYDYDTGSFTCAYIYDKTDVDNITLQKTVMIKGYYSSSRKIGTDLYLVANFYPAYNYVKDTDILPCYIEDGQITYQSANDIWYFDDMDSSNYLILAGIDLSDLSSDVNLNTYLGNGHTVYMSPDNMYVTYTSYKYQTSRSDSVSSIWIGNQNTVIHKFKAQNAVLTHVAMAEVEGYLINQFAMDEHDGFFRVAVTSYADDTTMNNVYIFDENLNMTGSIMNMAPGERIYSVRFNGDTGYMVTFVQVDPLFVMDLSDPYNPEVDGELKIPGYSTYMHMYSDTLVIGFGMDTDDFEGRVLTNGLKIAMFDVSDKNNPVQLFQTVIGKAGTYSEFLYNHKAFMFSRARDVFAFPAQITSINYEMKDQGLVVVKIDMQNNTFDILDILSQDYFSNWNNYVQRGLYTDDILFTISNHAVYSYDFDSLVLIDNLIYD